MTDLSNAHDRFFKRMISRPAAARDLVLNYLPPEVTALLEPTTLALRRDSFVDEDLREHFSDLLYDVDLKSGGGAYVYVLFEHKSYVDRLTAFQLLRYIVRIWEQGLREGHSSLVPVIPVVVYHGQAAWRVGLDLADLFRGPEALRAYWPSFKYELCDLSIYDDEEIKGEIRLRVGLLLLKHIFQEDLRDRLPEILGLLRELKEEASALSYLETVLRYVAHTADQVSWEGLREAAQKALGQQGGETMNTLAEQLIQEGVRVGKREGMEQGIQQGREQGIQQGIQQGIRQGMQQGVREGLLAGIRLGLKLRFGDEGLTLLPEIYKIEDVDVLRTVHEALETVNKPADLRRFYQTPSDP
ncbi:MAG: Rpn family recombination-promoting nuclease/putative transposase [Anaerolineales bacterium]